MTENTTGRRLTVVNHDRAAAGLTYVYPVVSRRAGGVSVGVNLNVNNACNWKCIYCQVPNLKRGAAPPVDLMKLRSELTGFLRDVIDGDFMQRCVPEQARRLNDIALSGNGEPTSTPGFASVIEVIGEVRHAVSVGAEVKTVLITNGSLTHQREVREGLRRLQPINGEVWFKLDSATREGMLRMNGTRIGLTRVARNLAIAANACPTWIQTCVLAIDGDAPSNTEQSAYLEFIAEQLAQGVPIRGVLLYGLARQSYQPEADRLSSLPPSWLEAYAERIRALGLPVKVTP
ncbi:MAG: radical SAM protein [Betaproteobacteria bacterium]|nr:MAG: radical SAM protein [Betaproteobacteria bacterium]